MMMLMIMLMFLDVIPLYQTLPLRVHGLEGTYFKKIYVIGVFRAPVVMVSKKLRERIPVI